LRCPRGGLGVLGLDRCLSFGWSDRESGGDQPACDVRVRRARAHVVFRLQWAARTRSAVFSPIMIVGAFVLPPLWDDRPVRGKAKHHDEYVSNQGEDIARARTADALLLTKAVASEMVADRSFTGGARLADP